MLKLGPIESSLIPIDREYVLLVSPDYAPKYIGHRSRIVMLEKLIEHMLSRKDVWFATHEDIARYVKKAGGIT